MCEEEQKSRITVRHVLTSLGGSGAAGAAKASPGAIVGAGALELLSTDLQTLISIGTLIYILMMILYSAPKVAEAMRYFYRLWKYRNDKAAIVVNQVRDHDVTDKIQELEIEHLRKRVAELEAEKERWRS